ncbi:MAG TPA: glycosyltransferase family 2 protein [Tepidisphaeraceae bacterium]
MRTLIAIPIYNERQYVEHVMRRVTALGLDVLVVDDHSTDGTSEFLVGQPDVDIIRHGRNCGYGQGIIDAFDHAHRRGYDWVVTLDADEQHEPEIIPKFIEAAAAGDADIISGSRYTDLNVNDDLAPGDRRAINMTLTATLNDLFGWKLTDSFCGFKIHRVAAMQQLRLDETGYAFPLQLWPRAFEHKLRVKEIPVKRIYNDATRTFGGDLDDANRRLKHYLSVLKRELVRIGHDGATCLDSVTIGSPLDCCGCP